jgi:hypothetical protein
MEAQRKRNLILVPLNANGTHHAQRIAGRSFDRMREAGNNREYEIRDADTGEVLTQVELERELDL